MHDAANEPDAEADTAKLAEHAAREAFLAEMSPFVEALRLGLINAYDFEEWCALDARRNPG